MNDISMKDLKNKATEMRMKVVDMIYKAQSGHPGGSLSAAEFVTACYFKYMNVDPENPKWEDRDRMVLSKGHVCPIQYACLGTLGFFPEEVLDTLRKEGSPLQGHPSMIKCPGIDISTGSLGQGMACAAGMALGGKMNKKDYKVFCVLGDGESQEGIIWEGANTANKYKLDNFIVFVDEVVELILVGCIGSTTSSYSLMTTVCSLTDHATRSCLTETSARSSRHSAGTYATSTEMTWKKSAKLSTGATQTKLRTATLRLSSERQSRARA